MRTGLFAVGVMVYCAGSIGCASVEGMRALPIGEGEQRVYADTDFEAVVAVSRDAIRDNQELVLLSDEAFQPPAGEASGSARMWMLVGELPGNFWTHHGSKVRVLVLETGESETAVRICTRRNQGINVTAPADLAPRLWPMIEGSIKAGEGKLEAPR